MKKPSADRRKASSHVNGPDVLHPGRFWLHYRHAGTFGVVLDNPSYDCPAAFFQGISLRSTHSKKRLNINPNNDNTNTPTMSFVVSIKSP